MEQCTWKDCLEGGLHRQIDRDGKQWAVLCDLHNKELDQAIDIMVKGDPKAMLSAWVKAQGGANKAAKRMVGEVGEGRQLILMARSVIRLEAILARTTANVGENDV